MYTHLYWKHSLHNVVCQNTTLILDIEWKARAIYKSVNPFKSRGNKWYTICFATILLLYKLDVLLLKENKQPVMEITHFFWCTAAFTCVVRLKKNPVMSNTDRFFYLNSTVFLLGYMMIIVPPYSDMGHILYIPWILRINLFKPSNPSKIHGIYGL